MIEAQASKTVLKIRCKSFLVYLGAKDIVLGIIAIRRLAPKSLASCSDNLLSDLGAREKSEGVTEECFL